MPLELPPLPPDASPRLVVGFSGGRDSTVLLHRLVALRATHGWSLRAVHVDHGLHPASGRWAEAAMAAAASMGVRAEVVRAEVHPAGRGKEDAARRARFVAFASVCGPDDTLVLAHHRDDQVETVLLALLRGADRGLAGMRPWTVDDRGGTWRPLLEHRADAIAAYARTHDLRWIEDPSNADDRFDRNALRRTFLPALHARFPGAATAIAALAERQARRLDDADAQAALDLSGLLDATGDTLDADGLRALPASRGDHALRRWARLHGGWIGDDAVRRVLDEWAAMPPGRAMRHALGSHWLRQWDGRLWWTAREPAPPRWPDTPWDGTQPLALGGSGWLELVGASGFDTPLQVRGRAGTSDRIALAAVGPRSLARLLPAWRIPPWQRDAVPVLTDGSGRLVAIADLGYAADFDAWLHTRGARLVWQPDAALG